MRRSSLDGWIENTRIGNAKNDDGGCRNEVLEIFQNFRSKIVRISVLERNLGIGEAIPLSSFAAKAISLQWLSAKRDF